MHHRQQSSDARDSMHPDELSIVLRDVHAQNMVTFQRILAAGRSTSTEESRTATDRFWDIVVITAGDLQQQLCYQRQIDLKLVREQIPRQAKYDKQLLEQSCRRLWFNGYLHLHTSSLVLFQVPCHRRPA